MQKVLAEVYNKNKVLGLLKKESMLTCLCIIDLFRSVKLFSLINLFSITLFARKIELQNRVPPLPSPICSIFFFLANALTFILEGHSN